MAADEELETTEAVPTDETVSETEIQPEELRFHVVFVPIRLRPWVESFATLAEWGAAISRVRNEYMLKNLPIRCYPFVGERTILKMPAPVSEVIIDGFSSASSRAPVPIKDDWLVEPDFLLMDAQASPHLIGE